MVAPKRPNAFICSTISAGQVSSCSSFMTCGATSRASQRSMASMSWRASSESGPIWNLGCAALMVWPSDYARGGRRGGRFAAPGGVMKRRFFVRAADVPSYHPANHTGTTNKRLVGADNVGAQNVELVLGVIEKGRGADPHAHPAMEQVCYLLEGTALAEVGGERCEMRPGAVCYFPAAEMPKFTATSIKPVKM